MNKPAFFPAPTWRDQFLRAVADADAAQANDLLDQAERRQTADARGYNMALVRGAMRGSRGGVDEFDESCVYQLACMYDHPPIGGGGGAGCFSYESPTEFLDAPLPPTITPGLTAPPQRIQFNSFGAGLVIGIIGEVLDAATGLPVATGTVNFRMQLNGDKNFNTDGQTQTFTNFGSILRTSLPYFPWRRLVSSLDFLDVQFQSNVAPAGISVIPRFTLCFGSLLRRVTQ